MDPLLRPEFLLLLLEQGERSLEGHTRLFLVLSSYPDDALCSFYDAGLNIAYRAPSSEDGPRANFAAFVEWTLARHGSPFTVCPEGDLASATQDPVPSPPSPRCAACMHRRTERQCWGSPRSQSRWWRQSRCVSRQQRPPRGRIPRTVWARRGAPPPAPRLRVSWVWSVDCATTLEKGLHFPSLAQGGPQIPSPALLSLLRLRWSQPAPFLQSALQCPLLENARPPTHSCLLHRCRLAAPLLALSPPSMRCELGETAILQRRRGRSFPRLRLQPPRPGLRLGPLTRRLHHGS